MKTLYLIRHAKSDWSHEGLSDYDRPLNKRGKRDAPFMAGKLNELNVSLDQLISSTANRAITTALFIAEGLSQDASSIVKKDELYHASVQELQSTLNSLSDDDQVVGIVAHNPGLTMFSNYLTDNYIDNVVTTGIVKVEFDVESWQEIIQGSGTKVFYIYPKMYLQ